MDFIGWKICAYKKVRISSYCGTIVQSYDLTTEGNKMVSAYDEEDENNEPRGANSQNLC